MSPPPGELVKFMLIRSRTIVDPNCADDWYRARCQGRGCGRILPAGEPVHLVVKTRAFITDPANPTTRAYLCDDCIAKLGDRVEEIAQPAPRPRPSHALAADPF